MFPRKENANSVACYAIPVSSSYRMSWPFRFSDKRPREWFLVRHHRPRNQLLMVKRDFTETIVSDPEGGEPGDSEAGDEASPVSVLI